MNLYKLARNANTARALTSANPGRIARRGRNLGLGRLLARGGLFRWLFGGRR